MTRTARLHRRPRMLRAPLALALAATLTLAGCGEDTEPEADSTPTADQTTASESPTGSGSPSETATPSEEAAETVEITIAGDDVTPMAQQVEVGVGERLVLEVTSDRAGELHVHSNPEQEPSFAKGTSRIALTFDKPGQVDVEEHESGALILRVLVQ